MSNELCSSCNFKITLNETSEIPWGPSLFHLSVNNFIIKDRLFLKPIVDSSPDHYHALTEYIYKNRNYYFTQLFILNCQSKKFATYGRINNSLIAAKAITMKKIIFNRQIYTGLIEEYELPLSSLTWLSIETVSN